MNHEGKWQIPHLVMSPNHDKIPLGILIPVQDSSDQTNLETICIHCQPTKYVEGQPVMYAFET